MEVVNLDKVIKTLRILPTHIKVKLLEWARSIELQGIRVVRVLPGYHDESLKGKRRGQRSIRLSRSYRAIYTENNDGEIKIITVEEVNKHEY